MAALLNRSGDALLAEAPAALATWLRADLVAVAELLDDGRVRSVAIIEDGRPAPAFEGMLAGMAAAALVPATAYCVGEGVCRQFPGDMLMARLPASGSAGVALRDARGQTVGLVIAAWRAEVPRPDDALAIFRLVAGPMETALERPQRQRERQQTADQLRQVQRLDAVARLAGGLAHDFNNLLMIMMGYAEILRDRDGRSPEVLQLLAAGGRATTLVRQLLAYGRRQVLHTERLDLNALVDQVRTLLSPVLSPRVQLSTSLEPSLALVDADRGQLEQVLVNLALNARDAMPDGGTLHLSTSIERFTSPHRQMPAGEYVCLTVRDSGVGMTADVQAHIFEPFYTTKGSRGSGLGLSSVYGIVKQSGGFIWCESAPGRGTTFRVYLRPAAPATAAAGGQARLAGGREHVLVVDDETNVRKSLTRVLQARGYRVSAAEDAATALALMADEAKRPALVITDIIMPGVTGTQLAETIEREWPSTRLLLMSRFAGSASVRTAPVVARVPLIEKPFTPDALAARVRAVLDGADTASRVA